MSTSQEYLPLAQDEAAPVIATGAASGRRYFLQQVPGASCGLEAVLGSLHETEKIVR